MGIWGAPLVQRVHVAARRGGASRVPTGNGPGEAPSNSFLAANVKSAWPPTGQTAVSHPCRRSTSEDGKRHWRLRRVKSAS